MNRSLFIVSIMYNKKKRTKEKTKEERKENGYMFCCIFMH